MAPLDERDRDLLEQYKASLLPSDAVVQSSWKAVVDRIEHEPTPQRGGRVPWMVIASVATVALTSFAVLGAIELLRDEPDGHPVQSLDEVVRPHAEMPAIMTGTDVQSRDAGITRARIAANPQAEHSQAEPSLQAEPKPPEPRAPDVGTKQRQRGARGSGTKGRTAEATPTEPGLGDIRAELELVAQTRKALEAEDFARVLGLVRRYEREFPKGMMREEVAMLRVGALCEVGPQEQWVKARTHFEREFPGSPLLTHLREDCSP